MNVVFCLIDVNHYRWIESGGAVRRTKKVSESPLPRHGSGRTKLTPLVESGGAAFLESQSRCEVSFLVEVVVNRADKRGEFLQTSHPPEAKHGPFPSSKRLVRILGAIVQPATDLARVDGAQYFERNAVGGQSIRDDRLGRAMPAKRIPQKLQRRLLVPALRHKAFEHLALVIDRAPEIVLHGVDLHEHLIEMPAPMSEIPHRPNTAAPDLGREDGAETVPPEPHRLMRDVDAALMQQVFHIPQRQRVAHLHHHREAHDLGTGLEGAENAGVAHTIEGNGTLPGGNRSFNLTLPSGLRSD